MRNAEWGVRSAEFSILHLRSSIFAELACGAWRLGAFALNGFRRDALGGLPQMPPLTGLNLCLAHGPYRDAAPTALGGVPEQNACVTKMPRRRRLRCCAQRFERATEPSPSAPEVRHLCSRAPATTPQAPSGAASQSSTQMPRLRGSICVGCDGFYTDAAPTGLGILRRWCVLQRCRAYGAWGGDA
jgi:hypothetical protein